MQTDLIQQYITLLQANLPEGYGELTGISINEYQSLGKLSISADFYKTKTDPD